MIIRKNLHRRIHFVLLFYRLVISKKRRISHSFISVLASLVWIHHYVSWQSIRITELRYPSAIVMAVSFCAEFDCKRHCFGIKVEGDMQDLRALDVCAIYNRGTGNRCLSHRTLGTVCPVSRLVDWFLCYFARPATERKNVRWNDN